MPLLRRGATPPRAPAPTRRASAPRPSRRAPAPSRSRSPGPSYLTGPYKGAPVRPVGRRPRDRRPVRPRHRRRARGDPRRPRTTRTSSSTPTRCPTILKGIPLRLRHVNVTIDRAGFLLNPTACGPHDIVLEHPLGRRRERDAAAARFTITGCDKLKFTPTITAVDLRPADAQARRQPARDAEAAGRPDEHAARLGPAAQAVLGAGQDDRAGMSRSRLHRRPGQVRRRLHASAPTEATTPGAAHAADRATPGSSATTRACPRSRCA